VIEGEYGTTVGETGPEEPGLSTVLPKHAQGDMDPVRELPYRLAALNTAAPEAGQMAASDKRVRPLQKLLAPQGASTDGKQTSAGRFGTRSEPTAVSRVQQLMIDEQDLRLRLVSLMSAVSLLTFGALVEAYKLLT
jgi:hypothetical protein